MTPTAPPVGYAEPAARPTRTRRSRRLRREAARLLVMAVVLAVATLAAFAYGAATGAAGDRAEHSPIFLGTVLAVVTAAFGLAAGMQYVRSRSEDRAERRP